MGGGVPGGQRRAQGDDVGGGRRRGREHAAEVHLVDVAGGDRLSDRGHALLEAVPIEARRPRLGCRARPPFGRRGSDRLGPVETGAQGLAHQLARSI